MIYSTSQHSHFWNWILTKNEIKQSILRNEIVKREILVEYNQINKTKLTVLNNKLWCKIFCYLQFKDICSLYKTCKFFNEISLIALIWKYKHCNYNPFVISDTCNYYYKLIEIGMLIKTFTKEEIECFNFLKKQMYVCP